MKLSYRKTPYTDAEMRLLYEQSVGFKKLVDAVANASISGMFGPPGPTGIIGDALNVSGSLGRATGGKKYYHPAAIIYTMYKAQKATKAAPTDFEALALMTALQKYSRYAYKWIELYKKSDIGGEPHLYKKRVHPLHPPAGGAYRGFPLSYIDLRVPQGTSFDSQGRPIPASYALKRINFLDPRIVALFGDVWIGVDNKGKRVFLASTKKPRIDLADLLKLAGSGSGSTPSFPLDLDRVVADKSLVIP
jgi:hypothetical protein